MTQYISVLILESTVSTRQRMNVIKSLFKSVGNFIIKQCTLYNDTEYTVEVVDKDGTWTLEPGCREDTWLFAGFSIYFVMKYPGSAKRVEFKSSQFENRTHNMSEIFGTNQTREFGSGGGMDMTTSSK